MNNDNYTKDQFKNIEYLRSLIHNSKEIYDNFSLRKYVNSGSCGVVYEAISSKSPKKVGLKFIITKLLDRKREQQKLSKLKNTYLNKEMKIQRELKHQNITQLLDTKYIDITGDLKIPCLVMDYAAYGDLYHFQNNLIKKKTSTETAICYFTKQILESINYCHRTKLIHMDIKPQNILIDENINVKLSDFSVSLSYLNIKDKIKLPLAGTSLYMSPEVLGKEEIDVKDAEKIDLYSLGMLIFNLAFAEYPYGLKFSDKKEFDILKAKIKKNSLVIPESNRFSPLFRRFLSGLLDKDIKNRYNLKKAFNDPWIKGADIIEEEKEKIVDLEKFIICLYTDNIMGFNDYLKKNSTNQLNLIKTTSNEESTKL